MKRSSPVVRSAQNPHVKRARAVLAGREKELVALEGDRLVDDARRSGLELEAILLAADRTERAAELQAAGLPLVRVERPLLERVSSLSAAPGILALARVPPPPDPDALPADPAALLLVVAGLQDPGNLGALARSAEAAGALGLAVVAGGARPFSEKAVRGSMGSLLRLPVWRFPRADELVERLAARGFRQLSAATRGGLPPDEVDWRGPIAVWIGPETGLLPAACRKLERVTIPMRGRVESLNAAVAASLLLYAAGRVGGGP